MEEPSKSAELMAKLAEAQAEMPNPKKSREGQKGYQKYKYATLDAVLDIVKGPLNKRGIFLTQPTCRDEGGLMFVQTVVYGDGEQMVLDSKPYEYDSDPQEFGKRETYARRYSLLTAFGLAGEDDTDGDTGPRGTRPPANPTGHALGNTTKPKATPEQRRKKMLARCAELLAKCIENGMNSGFAEAYMKAKYGADSMDGLTDEQIVEFGAYLKEMAEQSADLKARKEQA